VSLSCFFTADGGRRDGRVTGVQTCALPIWSEHLDAMHHGVEVLGPDVNASRKDCTLEPRTDAAGTVGHPRPGWHADPSTRAVRMGLRYVRGLADALLDRIDAERDRKPFASLSDFTRRTGAPTDAIEALATAGAF